MITKIEVNGFKSLNNFSLHLRPGLNVLAGPNGSGKTNIIQFFEFLSHIVRGDVSEAVSRAGGAGSIFRRVGNQYQDSISATIYGCTPEERGRYVTYRYSFEILFPKEIESIAYRNQSFMIAMTKTFVDAPTQSEKSFSWQLAIYQESDSKLASKIKVTSFDTKLLRSRLFYSTAKTAKSAEKLFSRITSPNESLVNILSRYTYTLRFLHEDLARGETYNIIPSRVKIPEDSAKSPGIEKDGAGLAATLYAIYRKRPLMYDRIYWWYPPPSFKLHTKISLSDVEKYVALANESIVGIDVHNDPFNNQLKVTLEVKSGDYNASLPLASMSDGTVKWLALTTAVLTSSSIFSLEEPENYLHPLMQMQILKIMRDILFSKKKYAFTIMTTHSETVLNGCKPDELIVVSLDNGSTVARRCPNAVELRKEIDRTGFGLGYYYLAGAVTNE